MNYGFGRANALRKGSLAVSIRRASNTQAYLNFIL